MASGFGLNGGMYTFPAYLRDVCYIWPSTVAGPLQWTHRLTLCFPQGPSRCYPFWQEVLGCYVINAGEGETGKKKCVPALEDYYECLHHKKEVRLPANRRGEFEPELSTWICYLTIHSMR